MSKVAVVYWSGTGNTEAMANAVAEGAKGAGAEVDILVASDFNAGKVAEYDGIAFGCPAMGAENLEESEFEPMFTDVEGSLSGKKIALFGSYGWGSGEWMADWEERSKAAEESEHRKSDTSDATHRFIKQCAIFQQVISRVVNHH